MKPKNQDIVRKAYLTFSGYLLACIVLAITAFACFQKTAAVEVKGILQKTVEYDRVYAREIELTASIDSVYQYMRLMNTSPQINDVLLQSMVSSRKMDILRYMQQFDTRDCQLYRKLMNEFNVFLGVKDSVRLSKIQEELVRDDLMRCIQDNRKTKRRLNVGGITIEK